MLKLLLIGLAGVAGTLTRYWLSGILARIYGEPSLMEYYLAELMKGDDKYL